jgi:hypothetical protein
MQDARPAANSSPVRALPTGRSATGALRTRPGRALRRHHERLSTPRRLWRTAYFNGNSNSSMMMRSACSTQAISGSLPLARRGFRDSSVSWSQCISRETAHRYLGLERRVIVALHPLAGAERVTAFNAQAGLACVALSRHRLACIYRRSRSRAGSHQRCSTKTKIPNPHTRPPRRCHQTLRATRHFFLPDVKAASAFEGADLG